MHKTVDVELGSDILAVNLKIAMDNRKKLRENSVKAFDFLGAIGSGKTMLIENLVDLLAQKGKKGAAIAGDVAGDDDYKRLASHKIEVANINTGKECHLDAHMVEHALEKLNLSTIDYLFIENVGNLVCPADFPLGSEKRVVVISVTEGDDMIRKHPILMGDADIIVINKIDLASFVEVDINILIADAKRITPHTEVILTDAKHGKGVEKLAKALGL